MASRGPDRTTALCFIRTIFRPKHEDKPSEPATEEAQARATNAYRLLNQWKRPLGTKKDNSFDGAALKAWYQKVTDICRDSGRLEVGLQRVGHVLRYYPPDPDGLFMHRSVAEVLDQKDAGEVRTGFAVEIYNSRGAHFVDPHGGPERELANTHRQEAEKLDLEGYSRLAATLREVAAGYDREAEYNVVAARMDEENLTT